MGTRLRLQSDATTEARRLVRAQARVADARIATWVRRVGDDEALHGARTALRRLRVLVRGFRRELGPMARRGIRKRLRDASRATSGLRDLDVFVDWVATLPASSSVRHLLAAADADAAALAGVASRSMRQLWPEARRRLRAAKKRPRHPRACGSAAAAALRREIATVDGGLAAFDPITDPAAAHRTRIAAKRARYLVEALAARSPDTRRLVEWCRAFQDLVGEWRDASLATSRVRKSPQMSGRTVVLRRLSERRRQARADMRRFVADRRAWQIARRDGLAIARRYALGSRRLSRAGARDV